jgi:phosphatidylinositol alpha 1,6-mannosyltransferase
VLASVHTRFETYLRYYRLAWMEPVIEPMLRRFYRRCDALVAPSESMADVLREQRMNYDISTLVARRRSRGVQPRPPRPGMAARRWALPTMRWPSASWAGW